MNNQNRQRAASLQLNIDSRLNEILTYKRIYCVSSESQGRLSLGNKNTKYELTSGSVAEAPAAFFSSSLNCTVATHGLNHQMNNR